jgi:5-(carboxyamino)imidazole ribonucleotide mutase
MAQENPAAEGSEVPRTAGGRVLVGILMGSKSDLTTMQHTADTLTLFGVGHEMRVLSAHRTPEATAEYVRSAEGRGLEVMIAAAGGAAHLAGVVAAYTVLPVLGVPIQSAALQGLDSLLSMVQMPGGIPVGTLAIGKAGATNAAILAAQILGNKYPEVRERIRAHREAEKRRILEEKIGS